MFHQNQTAPNSHTNPQTPLKTKPTNLHLVTAPGAHPTAPATSHLVDLALIAARRSSGFFAEAAVLVLVFGILDFFILKGRIELSWILGALAISVGLLAASVATDFGTQRWIKAHP